MLRSFVRVGCDLAPSDAVPLPSSESFSQEMHRKSRWRQKVSSSRCCLVSLQLLRRFSGSSSEVAEFVDFGGDTKLQCSYTHSRSHSLQFSEPASGGEFKRRNVAFGVGTNCLIWGFCFPELLVIVELFEMFVFACLCYSWWQISRTFTLFLISYLEWNLTPSALILWMVLEPECCPRSSCMWFLHSTQAESQSFFCTPTWASFLTTGGCHLSQAHRWKVLWATNIF